MATRRNSEDEWVEEHGGPGFERLHGNASEDFWNNFPKRELPSDASTRVNVGKFRQFVEDVKDKMSAAEVRKR